MKKIGSLLLAGMMLASVLLFSGCQSATDKQSVDAIKKAGVITMYTNAEFPPYEYMNGPNVVGVDADIAKAIADSLGVKLEIKNVKFDTIIASIQSGKGSFGAAGMSVTEERQEQVDFSIKYATSKQYIILKEDSTVTKIEDLAGKKIGIQTGTTGDIIIRGEIQGKENVKGVLQDTGASVADYNNALEAAQALMSGKIDAVVIDKLPAESIVKANTGKIKTIELVYADGTNTEETYAICVAKGNTTLLNAINDVLNDLISKGKIDEFVITHTGAASK